MTTVGRAQAALPADLPRRPAPSPEEILTAFEVQPRTQNILRRYLADGAPSDGAWTFGRLLGIPGFGQRALDDVLAAVTARRTARVTATRRRHRYLDEEIAEILSMRQRRRAWMPTPLLDRALAMIGVRLPASEAEISRRLVSAGLARTPIDLARVERAARFGDVPPPFSVLRRDGFVLAVPAGKLAAAATIHGLAVRAVVNWGMAQVRRIGFLANVDDDAFVGAVLRAKDSFRWVDERLGWFWFASDRSPLVRAIEKVLQVAPAVSLDDLSQALFRRWAPENVPSRRALHGLCSQVATLRVRRNLVTLAEAPPGNGEPSASLTPAEESVLTLFRRFGPRIEGHRLQEIAESMGTGCAQLGRHLRSSPLVVEPRPGMFRLVGT